MYFLQICFFWNLLILLKHKELVAKVKVRSVLFIYDQLKLFY